MSAETDLAGADNYVLQEAIGAYADEAYTAAKKISSTGVVGGNPLINTNTETFTGQLRWFKPINQVVNTASLTNAADGTKSTYGSAYLDYIKTVRTHGAEKVNMQEVVTQVDGLAKFGRDLAETRGQDEHDAVLAVLKGVAISEALNGAAAGSGATGLGGQTFENDPNDRRYGFYVDLGANKVVVAASQSVQGAARAEGFLNALGMAFKDYEPEFAYLFTSPEVFASLRSANLVDQDRVTDGNVEFNTIFQGKLRLIQTRANQGMSTAQRTKLNLGAGVDIVGTKTSFIALPNSIAMEALSVPLDVEIDRDASAYQGGGTTTVWYRWGYVTHPVGYSWNGDKEAFPTNEQFMGVAETEAGGAIINKNLVDVTDVNAVKGAWDRRYASALSLGILPIFHN